jgi:membrane-associated phospholipid phosphatase
MTLTPTRPVERALPARARRRWPDRLRRAAGELLLGFLLYEVYARVRDAHGMATRGQHAFVVARQHAVELLAVERRAGLAVEHAMQSWALGHRPLLRGLDAFYGSAHFLVTCGVFVALVVTQPHQRFARWRSTLWVTTAAAVVGFAAYPTMPPRMLPRSYGFVDTLSRVGGLWSYDHGVLEHISDPLAAFPSLHIGWSCWCAAAVVSARRGAGSDSRLWWLVWAYPVVTGITVMVTGNHYLLDLLAGAACFATGYCVVRVAGRLARAAAQRLQV